MSRSLLALALLLVAGAAHGELEDPTRPALLPPAPVGSVGEPRAALRSVFISETRRVAVIGERRVEVGDRVGGARVVAIELSGVRLRGGAGHEGGEWRLELSDGVKRPAAEERSE